MGVRGVNNIKLQKKATRKQSDFLSSVSPVVQQMDFSKIEFKDFEFSLDGKVGHDKDIHYPNFSQHAQNFVDLNSSKIQVGKSLIQTISFDSTKIYVNGEMGLATFILEKTTAENSWIPGLLMSYVDQDGNPVHKAVAWLNLNPLLRNPFVHAVSPEIQKVFIDLLKQFEKYQGMITI